MDMEDRAKLALNAHLVNLTDSDHNTQLKLAAARPGKSPGLTEKTGKVTIKCDKLIAG